MAITGKKKIELSIQTVLERTTEMDIISHFMPNKNWEINTPTYSPFREEKHPSFVISNKAGYISYIDWGRMEYKGDVFNFVKQLYSLPNLDAVLRLIDKEMALGISEGKEIIAKIVKDEYTPEITKKNTLIQVITRKFTKEELAYWNQYLQSEEDLRREEIYSIKKVYLNKKLLSIADLRFGYYYGGTWKIYQPTENKRKKWLTNTPLTYLDGKENIKNCETAWVTKSKKDKMTLLKLFSCVAATQNESISCFSPENVEFIKNNSKKQVIIYDNDEAGVRACKQITNTFDFGYCNPPKHYLLEGASDFSDVVKLHGLKAIEEHFKQKGLI